MKRAKEIFGGCKLLFAFVLLLFPLVPGVFAEAITRTVLAGDQNSLPTDSPAARLDTLGAASPFNFVGALNITSGGSLYRGSAVAISPNWVLTAGHNVDFNDDGHADAGLAVQLYLPGFGNYAATSFFTAPGFTGFANPSIQHDLALLYFSVPLPGEIDYPTLGGGMDIGDVGTLVGFGRSGFGNYGYSTPTSLTDRRVGQNTIDTFTYGDTQAELFRYTFDSPDTVGDPGGSLGNGLETIIGPGDSGGPLLLQVGGAYQPVGINTFTEGLGGRFGDTGGGIVLAPYWSWVNETTGLPIPEPTVSVFLLVAAGFLFLSRRARGKWKFRWYAET